jgi:EmrB/QacA subfamily drug resistance transporter
MTSSSRKDSNFSKAQSSYHQASGATNKWWVLVAVGIGTFMSALDGSVVNTTLPLINRSLGSNIAAIEWVVTIYLLVLSGLLLSFGRLGDMHGHKMVYISGFVIFILSSAMCGLSPSVTVLVVFRGIQALGAAMLQANSPAILTKSFPSEQRGQALGMQATMTYLGLTVGPSLGGWLADQFSWRAVFYINVPVGLLTLWLSKRFIPVDLEKKSSERFDILGAFVFIAGLVALLFGLNQGQALGWTSGIILGSLGMAIVFITLFIFVELHTSNPMLDLSLFLSRQFSIAVSSAILNYICVYSILFLMPFYLIQGRDFNPAQAGLILTAMPIVMAIVAPLSGTLSDRIGTRIPAVLGMLVMGIGLLLLAGLDASTSNAGLVMKLAAVGFGIGTFISPNNSALMGAAPRRRQGIAAGMLATARNVGMVLGVGLAGAIFTTYLGNQSLLSQALESSTIFEAIRASFQVAAAVAILGVFVSAIRPEKTSS